MRDDMFFTLDLTTKKSFNKTELEEIKNKIKSINPEDKFFSIISNSCELNRNSQLEIYLETIHCEIENPEDLLDLIIEIEENIGNFEDKSQVEWVLNFPYIVKSWEKNGYEWSLILEEEDDYYDSEDSWRDWEDE
jgi:hypothetical protein